MTRNRRMHGMEKATVPHTVEELGASAMRAVLEANRVYRTTGDTAAEWSLNVAWSECVRLAHVTGDAEAALQRWRTSTAPAFEVVA